MSISIRCLCLLFIISLTSYTPNPSINTFLGLFFGNKYGISIGLHSIGYNVDILHTCTKEYDCFGNFCNSFVVYESTDTIGLFIIPEGSHYYTDGCFYASDTLKFLRTLTINEFFNYMMNK